MASSCAPLFTKANLPAVADRLILVGQVALAVGNAAPTVVLTGPVTIKKKPPGPITVFVDAILQTAKLVAVTPVAEAY